MGRMESNPMDETRPVVPNSGEQPPDETQSVQAGGEAPDQSLPVQTAPGASPQDLTRPITVQQEPPPPPPVKQKKSHSWIGWVLAGLFVLLLAASASVYSGYRSALKARLGFESTKVAAEAQAQFDLGMQDLQAGRFDLARQRFEYVIQIDPAFPGVTEQLAVVLLAMNSTATPTLVPTPTVTPTPDLRGREELSTNAQAALLAGDWNTAIDTLLILRKRDATYLAVKVDGMLFVALRNRGIDKIARQADLEGGTYDLALAERFGPLDVEARNWRDWAILYVRGASFWDVDWEQAAYYFSQLAQIAPNLVDGSGYTSWERYVRALLGYGDWFARQGMYCEAQEQYEAALNLRGDSVVQPTADFAVQKCQESKAVVVEQPPSEFTSTPSPTLEGPPVESTPEPTATPEPPTQDVPTETPTPSG
jgi:tetratricopeptide (TPR) repeat protein